MTTIKQLVEKKIREFRMNDGKLTDWVLGFIANPEVELEKVKQEIIVQKTKTLSGMDSQKATLQAEISQLNTKSFSVSDIQVELAKPIIKK